MVFVIKNGGQVIIGIANNRTILGIPEEHIETIIESLERSIYDACVPLLSLHRNYHIKAPNKIAIYDDRIEFFSPGQFPGPLDTQNLLNGISYLRNPAICKTMREAGFIEKLGSGFIEIFNSYAKYNLQPPIVIEGENYIKCVLPRLSQSEAKSFDPAEKLKQLFITQSEIIIRHLCVSRSTALRRLNDMCDSGFIERIGTKKSARYRRKGQNQGNT